MKVSRTLTALAVLAAASVSAQAQSWSTNFDTVGSEAGTFSSLTLSAGTVPVGASWTSNQSPYFTTGADRALALPDYSFATLSFTSARTDIPALLVSFWASTTFPDVSEVQLTLNGPNGFSELASPLTLNDVVPNTGPNPNPDGQVLNYYFMNPGVDSSGMYTLSFNNMPQSAGFRIDDVEVSAVPEPSAYVLAAAGIGLLAFMGRRRKASGAQQLAA
jgi:hypothetical protein